MTLHKVKINRLATGVPGLDAVLGGGLPEFSFNFIAGSPGCGKTTLVHQIMFSLATEEHPALYFTVFGEPPLKMFRYQQQFDFFDSAKVGRAVHFVSLTDEMRDGDLNKVLARIVAEVAARVPALVCVDSFRSLGLSSQGVNLSNSKLQQFIQDLSVLMTGWQATTFLIGDYASGDDQNPVLTVADGLIRLSQGVQRNSVVRKMEVSKMRGFSTLPGIHTFRISDAGIAVFAPPQIEAPSDSASTSPTDIRLRLGVHGLDDMMGGGLPKGHSLLVAGPSGSGKSILAAAFLAEGARCGETGVIAAFEQRATQSRGPVLADLIRSGRVGVVSTRAPGISVDEVAALLLAEIRRLKATRVVIDSLSGFELLLAPTFRDDFRESMARMVSALASTGASVLMTFELEDRYSDLRFSPYGTAFLTDAIIVLRYAEIEGRLERLMAVVKVRASAHSSQLHQFHIDNDGIQIGPMMAGHEGLLGGQPTQVDSTQPAAKEKDGPLVTHPT